jgi:hypothetical protein
MVCLEYPGYVDSSPRSIYGRGFKKRAVAEMMFETLAIFLGQFKKLISSFLFVFTVVSEDT